MTTLNSNSNLQTAEQIQKFISEIEKLYKFDQPGHVNGEQRENSRLPITMPVRIFPLTDALELRNFEYRGVTRDISTSGVGLVTADPIDGGFLKLEFEPFQSTPFNLLARVVFTNSSGFYFQVGCEFYCNEGGN